MKWAVEWKTNVGVALKINIILVIYFLYRYENVIWRYDENDDDNENMYETYMIWRTKWMIVDKLVGLGVDVKMY